MNLEYQHYKATVNRGKISPDTTDNDFYKKLVEEFSEAKTEFILHKFGHKSNLKQELMDLSCVIRNYYIFNGWDYEEELKRNINHQINRHD